MKKHLKFIIAMLVIMSLSITGCGKEKDNKEETTTEADDPRFVEATERTKDWFVSAASDYVSENVKDTDFKLYGRVYDVRTGVSESNVLQYASADFVVCFNANDVEKQVIADFSDNFARKFASDGAAGDIKATIYILPDSIYTQVEENNYSQIEEKAKGVDGYSKFGFNYSGIGDVINNVAGTPN